MQTGSHEYTVHVQTNPCRAHILVFSSSSTPSVLSQWRSGTRQPGVSSNAQNPPKSYNHSTLGSLSLPVPNPFFLPMRTPIKVLGHALLSPRPYQPWCFPRGPRVAPCASCLLGAVRRSLLLPDNRILSARLVTSDYHKQIPGTSSEHRPCADSHLNPQKN